jgi:hypothetical protein
MDGLNPETFEALLRATNIVETISQLLRVDDNSKYAAHLKYNALFVAGNLARSNNPHDLILPDVGILPFIQTQITASLNTFSSQKFK